MNGNPAVLEPTFTGYIATTEDALILFEACITGVLQYVARRPHDRERSHLVRSGSIFIYEENSSGIKRWTDGVTWSPSRILGNFLVYRELDKPFPPGEKKRAMKKGNRRPLPPPRTGDTYSRPETSAPSYSPTTTPSSGTYSDRGNSQSELERALVGSLVDSYGFKDSGLVKKTMSVSLSGETYHLVSYYTIEDVVKGVLNPPTRIESLRYIQPRQELKSQQNFRAPIDDVDPSIKSATDASNQGLYGYRPSLVAPPTNHGMPTPHPEYYSLHPSPYATHAAQSTGLSGYSNTANLQPQTAPNPYLPSPTATTQLTTKTEDHPSYRSGAGGYNTTFDSMSHPSIASSIPPSLNTGVATSYHDRNRSQDSTSPTIYRNPSISARSLLGDSSSSIDPSSSAAYQRTGYSFPGHLDSPSNAHLDQRGLPAAAFDPSVPRGESHSIPQSYYTGADRQNYYMGTGGHPNYPTAQPISAWTTTAPTQHHM